MPDWFVIVMGLGTVFVGLICLVLLCSVMSFFCKERSPKKVVPAVPQGDAPIENKQEMIAAVCAVIAEELGTDVTGIKVLSFQKVR